MPGYAAEPGEQTSKPSRPSSEATTQRVEIVANGEHYDARRDDTTTKIVVTRDEILKYGDSNLADVLKRQPRITVGRSGPGGSSGEIRMRGLGNGYTQILLDGSPAPSGFSIDSLEPSLVERIEIIPSATADMSTQAIAGTINIVLKKKVQVAQRDIKLHVEESDVFLSRAAILQLSDKLDRFSYSIGAELRHFRVDQDYTTVEDASDNAGRTTLLRSATYQNKVRVPTLTVTPRFNWTLANGDTISSQSFIRANRYDSDRNNLWTAQEGPQPPYPRGYARFDDSNFWFNSDLNWIHRFASEGKLDTKISGTLTQTNQNFDELGFNTADMAMLNREVDSDVRNKGWTWTGKYTVPLSAQHVFGTGWETGSVTNRAVRNQTDAFGGTGDVTRNNERSRATVDHLALYVQDEWTISPAWSTYFGARWEGVKTTTTSDAFAKVSNRSNVLSPIFQTLWKLPGGKGDQLRVALSRTYKRPEARRLVRRPVLSLNNSVTAPDLTGNPDLLPESALGLDVSLERFAKNGGMAGISGYIRKVDDFIRNDIHFDGSRWISQPINDGDALARGITLETKLPMETVFDWAKRTMLRANLSRNWSSVSNVPGPNNRLADQVKYTATIGIDYNSGGKFSAGGSFVLQSGGTLQLSPHSQTYSTNKRDLDMYGLWKIGASSQVRLSLSNLLSRSHTSASRYTDASGTRSSTSVFPSGPMARINWEYKL